ncbi:genetic competence negative regulator [Virgibacillus kimchii]
MRMERLSINQFTIFLTFDDLIDRGFTRDELKSDVSITQDLFSDMMHEASAELDFKLEGMLHIQVYLMQAQGMHIIVTQNSETEEENDEEYISMKVTMDERTDFIFAFENFEDIIRVSDYLSFFSIKGGEVYYFNQQYYMFLKDTDLEGTNKENIIAVLSEFASPSFITKYRLREYGVIIYSSGAINQILQHFY